MKRRNFLSSTILAGGAVVMPAFADVNSRYYYELIRYELINNSKMQQLEKYWEEAAIPAFNRLGVEPVGVFRSQYGSHGLDLYVFIPHSSYESFETSWDKITADQLYQEKGKNYINTTMSDPLYYRYETSLLRAFTTMKESEIPSHIKGKRGRIFELRIYESHNRQKAKLKVEMFNEGGEIALFRETGLHPVFFGETLAGRKMPNLVYMLGFESMEERDKNWNTFRVNEKWKTLSANERYKDTVSSVTDVMLRAAACSQM